MEQRDKAKEERDFEIGKSQIQKRIALDKIKLGKFRIKIKMRMGEKNETVRRKGKKGAKNEIKRSRNLIKGKEKSLEE